MQLYFLFDEHGDGSSFPGLTYMAYAFIFFVVIALTFVEASIMTLMRYNTFQRSLRDSAIVNLASAAVAVLLSFSLSGAFEPSEIVGIAGMLIIPILLEAFLLQLRNKERAKMKTVTVSLVMNVISYLILFAISKS